MKEKINIRLAALIIITLLVGIWRIFQTSEGMGALANFTPIGAMALFGGAYFMNKGKAYLFPLLALFASDVVLMQTVYAEHSSGLLYSGWYWTYISFAIMVLIGKSLITKVSFKTVIGSGILAGLAHFIIANFGVWLGGGLDVTTGLPYTRDFAGIMKCYYLAIPFFKNMVAGNLAYGAILFGGFELAKARFDSLRKPVASGS